MPEGKYGPLTNMVLLVKNPFSQRDKENPRSWVCDVCKGGGLSLWRAETHCLLHRDACLRRSIINRLEKHVSKDYYFFF